ncbi:MAG: VTT domain-containing protein [Pirellulaceae bacterium]
MPSLFSRRIATLLLFILLIVLMGLGQRYIPSWGWIVDHEQALREYVSIHPISSWCVGLLIYFAISLIPGTSGKSVVCGWLFGFWQAFAMVELGLTGAAVVSFLGGRFLARDVVEPKWRRRLRIFRRQFALGGARYLLLLRLAHAPFTLINYGAGAIKVPLPAFCWTTLLGILPGTMVFTFAGTRVPSLKIVAEQGVWSLLDLPLLAAMTGIVFLPLLFHFLLQSLAKRMHQRRSIAGGTNSVSPELPECQS